MADQTRKERRPTRVYEEGQEDDADSTDPDNDGNLIYENIACFRGKAVALRSAVDGLRWRVAARVVGMPVLAFVSAEPLPGHSHSLPIGVAAPAGKFSSLIVTTIEPPYREEIQPTLLADAVARSGSGCQAGFLCCGTCRQPTMDYFAIPLRTAGYLAGLPRGTRLALALPPQPPSSAVPFLDIDLCHAQGVLMHAVSSWPGMLFDPELCYPPGTGSAPDDEKHSDSEPLADAEEGGADGPASTCACCWFGAGFVHAERFMGQRSFRALTSAETATIEDQVKLLRRQWAQTPDAGPGENGTGDVHGDSDPSSVSSVSLS